MYWLKFNIYSIILTVIAVALLCVFILLPVLHRYWWEYAFFIPLIWYVLKFADSIFTNFSYKMNTRKMLIEKSKQHFDQRLFVPYMDSPCMRHVVFFTLIDLGKGNEYQNIVRRAANKRLCNIFSHQKHINRRIQQ